VLEFDRIDRQALHLMGGMVTRCQSLNRPCLTAWLTAKTTVYQWVDSTRLTAKAVLPNWLTAVVNGLVNAKTALTTVVNNKVKNSQQAQANSVANAKSTVSHHGEQLQVNTAVNTKTAVWTSPVGCQALVDRSVDSERRCNATM
jgi:hypothetical protein